MTVLKGEIKVVAAVLEEADDVAEKAIEAGEDPPTIEYVATQIIEALDEYRDGKATFTILACYHANNGWKFFTYGPFKSRAVAKQKSGGLFPPGSPFRVRWLILENVKNFKNQVVGDLKAIKSAWDGDSVPDRLIRSVEFIEPFTPEEE